MTHLSQWRGLLGRQIMTTMGARIVIADVCATGGSGVVFCARLAENPQALVAVKCRLPERPIPASSFVREAELLATIRRHANVIASYGMTREPLGDLGCGLVVEWAPASLQRLIGQLPWERFLPIFAGLLQGLEHLHSSGIIHRDVTPENIVFTPFEPQTAKLADFGIAVSLDGPMITADSINFGKPGYIHPQAAELGPCPALDLYSLGATAFRILTADFPHRHGTSFPAGSQLDQADFATAVATGYLHQHGEDLRAEFSALIADLLTNRITSADEALDRVGDFSTQGGGSCKTSFPIRHESYCNPDFPASLLESTAPADDSAQNSLFLPNGQYALPDRLFPEDPESIPVYRRVAESPNSEVAASLSAAPPRFGNAKRSGVREAIATSLALSALAVCGSCFFHSPHFDRPGTQPLVAVTEKDAQLRSPSPTTSHERPLHYLPEPDIQPLFCCLLPFEIRRAETIFARTEADSEESPESSFEEAEGNNR